MPIYVYETIPDNPGEEPKYHEINQSETDDPLTVHPETGESIRRVVLGKFGVLSSTGAIPMKSNTESDSCGPGCCCG